MSNRKVYCTDNGLLTSTSFSFSADAGRLYENTVAVTLRKQEMEGAVECFYWQSAQQEEVDFVIKRGTGIAQLIQVCYSLQDPKTKSRETRALLKASSELGCKDLLILTDSTAGEEEVSWHGVERTVRCMPLWKWLLDRPS